MKYYSQFGQDEYLYETYFKGKTDGIYVDIGAHDGITGSNTYLFELLGWQGICFEPVPEIFERLKLNRKCLLRQIALSDRVGYLQFRFIRGYSEMLSGLVDQCNEAQLSRINREIEEHHQTEDIIEVQTSLFGTQVPFKHIDILSIDVEGAENAIIRSIDFNSYDIKFLTVEFNSDDQDLHSYIERQGYHFDRVLGVDRIFKKN